MSIVFIHIFTYSTKIAPPDVGAPGRGMGRISGKELRTCCAKSAKKKYRTNPSTATIAAKSKLSQRHATAKEHTELEPFARTTVTKIRV